MSQLTVFSEAEWFDTFYPKAWGDWRKEFNIKKANEHYNASACTWMDYKVTGYLSASVDGIMAVNTWKHGHSSAQDNFFIECGTLADEGQVAYFIQPYLQQSTGMYFARVQVTKEESNLDLYKIYIVGCDDASYSKHFIGQAAVDEAILDLKTYGIDHIQDKSSGYFFTN